MKMTCTREVITMVDMVMVVTVIMDYTQVDLEDLVDTMEITEEEEIDMVLIAVEEDMEVVAYIDLNVIIKSLTLIFKIYLLNYKYFMSKKSNKIIF